MSTMSAARAIRDLPGPRGLPLIGSLHKTWRIGRAHIVVEEWADRYGPLYKFHVGRRLMVVVSDPEEINRVLRERPEGFRRWREIEAGFQEIGFPGVFSVEGEVWRRQRQLVVRALNTNHLHRHFHVDPHRHRAPAPAARGGRPRRPARRHQRDPDLVHRGRHLGARVRPRPEHARARRRRAAAHIQRVFKMLGFGSAFPCRTGVGSAARRPRARALAWRTAQRRAWLHRAGPGTDGARPELFEEPENFLEAMLAAQAGRGRSPRGNRRQRVHAADRRRGHDRAHDGLDELVPRPTPRRPNTVGTGGTARCSARRRTQPIPRPSRSSRTARRCSGSRCA